MVLESEEQVRDRGANLGVIDMGLTGEFTVMENTRLKTSPPFLFY